MEFVIVWGERWNNALGTRSIARCSTSGLFICAGIVLCFLICITLSTKLVMWRWRTFKVFANSEEAMTGKH